MAKTKIQKTNRIRLKNATIYCSCDVIREIRAYVLRAQQILIPKKGDYLTLVTYLKQMSVSPKWADHFPQSTKNILEGA